MPKIDPVTGCVVQTHAEFWQSEAEREGQGRTGGEVAADFYEEWDKEIREEEVRYKTPDYALGYLRAAVERWNEADPETALPLPERILEVLDVQVKQGFRDSGLRLVVKAIRNGDVEDTLTYEEWSSSGDRINPPDYDEVITWETLKGE